MRRLSATAFLCVALSAGGADLVHAATGEGDDASKKSKRGELLDTRVPIPSYSKDVKDNGCHVRASPQEVFVGPDVDLQHIRFEDLIGEVVGRYSVRAIIDPPAAFVSSLDDLDPETRTLAKLDVLRNGLGRDGLHTFFYMSSGALAPFIRDALQDAGMIREHALFADAMGLFGATYPVEEEERAKRYSYSSLDTPMNDFDRSMLDLSAKFGTRKTLGNAMVAYVERTPTLWHRVEDERAKLGEVGRLRYLLDAIAQRARTWEAADANIGKKLAELPLEQRTLLAMHVFNAEFSNGGVHQFFLNSSGALAPDVYDAFVELGMERQAAIYKRGLDMFGAKYVRDTERRRARFFDHGDWNDWDKRLSALTDEFYAINGGVTVVQLNAGGGVAGGPGLWPAMAVYARNKKLLPC
jgi:hypothetical protein